MAAWKNQEVYYDETKSATFLEVRVPDPVSDQQGQTRAAGASPTVCRRFGAEINPCQPWFNAVDRATGRRIDLHKSFEPSSCLAFLIKLLLGGLTLVTLVYSWSYFEDDYPAFYLAYLTHWALLESAVYFLLSITYTLLAAWTPQPPDTLPFCSHIRWTWVVYEVAVHTEIVVSLIWWALIFKPGETVLNLRSVVPHCVIAVAVLIDGMLVNRIPVRLTHWYGFVLPCDCLYIIWTVIHAYAGVGNPIENDNDPVTNDDVIYDSVNWIDEPLQTAILSLVVVFGIGPAVYLVIWLLSLYNLNCFCLSDRRIYIDTIDETESSCSSGSYTDEGSLFDRSKYSI